MKNFAPAIGKTRKLFTASPCAARALLISRGIEAPTDAAAFDNFENYFIQAGLIDRRFESVIQNAHQINTGQLSQLEEEVYGLLHAVEGLYRSMDNSLRFPAEAKTTA